jgi:lysophospholipase L1-like esterase
LFSQTDNVTNPPTLQVGLNGLTLNKGGLDAQLIMEIVAEKQSEIKIRIVQNMFLDNLQNSGGTVYNYANNMLKVITEEPDSNLRTKLALENTVNLVFAYAFADFMMGKNDPANNHIKTLLNAYNLQLSATSKSFGNIKKLESINVTPDNKDEFVSLILDMSSEVIRNNSRLKELGVMSIPYSVSYDYLNTYNKLYKENPRNFALAKNVYDLMTAKLDEFLDIAGVINYFVNEYSFNKSTQINSANLTAIAGFTNPNNFDGLKKEIDETIKIVSLNWTKDDDSIFSESVETLKKIRDEISRIERIENLNTETYITSDILYILKNDIAPTLSKYIKFNSKLNDQLTILNNQIIQLAEKILKTANFPLDDLKNNKKINFIKLLSTIYEFNKAKTYSDYLNIISELENVFLDDKINTSISILNSYVKNNISVKKTEQGKEYLEFNIESFLMNLSKTSNNKIRNWQFHFTVGVNNIYFRNPLKLSDESFINNYSFVSEKIGVKYKFYNPGGWKPRNFGEQYSLFGWNYLKTSPPHEPLVSNYHLLLYGSGILYNITSTGTSKEFNYPILGYGIGITFYNALDLNLTMGYPIRDNLSFSQNFAVDSSYIGIGFDIQFIEYFNRLTEKRKNAQIQKNLASQNNVK